MAARPDGSAKRRRGAFFGLPIVRSKLVRPPVPRGFTPRPRVVAALGESPTPVSVVLAPAGYGKTSAVVDALASEPDGDVAWLSIDAYDSRESSFWAHLVAALDGARPGIQEAVFEANPRSRVPDGTRLASSLLEVLDDEYGLVVVLDDVHRLEGEAVWDQLAYFLERLPPGVRAVLTSRAATPLPLERWLSQDRAVVVDQRTLRFQDDEAARLVAEVWGTDASEAQVAELVSRSEGWVVGLLFEALTMERDGDTTATTKAPVRSSSSVINYLTTEVLATLSDDDQRFLLSISVLDEFDDELCRQVTGEPDAGVRLRRLQVANLFMVPLDESGGRFRFHHLFQALLLEELARRDPGQLVELHRRAAAVTRAAGDDRAPIHHLLEAGDNQAAFELLMECGWSSGSLAATRELVAGFPTGFILEDLTRILDYVLILSMTGDFEVAEQWCDRAEALVVEEEGPLRARLELQRSINFGSHGEVDQAMAAMDACLAAGARSVEGDESLARLPSVMAARILLHLTHDLQAPAAWLDEARRLPVELVHIHQVTIPALTAALRLRTGDLVGAERLARQVLVAADQLGIPPGIHMIDALLVLVAVLLETGRLEEEAEQIRRLEEMSGLFSPLAYQVFVVLATVEHTAALDGPAAAVHVAARAREDFARRSISNALSERLRASHATWLLASGRTNEAVRLVDSLPDGPETALLQAKLACVEHRNDEVPALLADTSGWFASERFEAELVVAAATGYHDMVEVVERHDGFVWTVVKQGQPLLRRLASHVDASTPAVDRVLRAVPGFHASFSPASIAGPTGDLTDRERALLRLLPSHLTYGQMAAESFVSINTVKSNLKMLYRKLGVSTRAEAVERARSLGID